MPRVRPLTQEQKKDYLDDIQTKKIREILSGYLGRDAISFLADLMHVNPQSLWRKFRGYTKWDIETLTLACDVLQVSPLDRAKMLTREKK